MTTKTPTIVFKRVIPASPAEVYAAWTQPDVIRQWLAPGENQVLDAQSDVRVGGSFRIRSRAPDGVVHTIDGEYRALVPAQRILMTWSYSGPIALLCSMETLLEVVMHEAAPGETVMTVTQSGFATSDAADAYGEGWPTCFDKLERAMTDEHNNKNATDGGMHNAGESDTNT